MTNLRRVLAVAIGVLLVAGIAGAVSLGRKGSLPLVRFNLAGQAAPGASRLAGQGRSAGSGGAVGHHGAGPAVAGAKQGPTGRATSALPVPQGSDLPTVPALGALRKPDALVTLPGPATAAEIARVTALRGVSAVEEVDTGTVELDGAPAVTFGVDPGTFRAFTPGPSARDTELWRYLAAGSLVSSFDMAESRHLELGSELPLVPQTPGLPATSGWLGAFASIGLPGVDLLVDRAYAPRLGLTSDGGLVVSAPGAAPAHLERALETALPGASVEVLDLPVATYHGGGAVPGALGASQVAVVLRAALSRVGMPYLWGATGPDAFDCSGLVVWSFAQAGISMPRTAAQQFLAGVHVRLSEAKPGDLLFWTYDPSDPTFVDHVAIYLGRGLMIQAPYSGADVQVVPVSTAHLAGVVSVVPAVAAAVGGPRVPPAAS